MLSLMINNSIEVYCRSYIPKVLVFDGVTSGVDYCDYFSETKRIKLFIYVIDAKLQPTLKIMSTYMTPLPTQKTTDTRLLKKRDNTHVHIDL